MELTGTSYINVTNAEGTVLYSGEPRAGEEIILEDLAEENQVVFNFGASQNARLFIAGELLEFPLDIVHQKIDIRTVNESVTE